jgi:hypothetical protein
VLTEGLQILVVVARQNRTKAKQKSGKSKRGESLWSVVFSFIKKLPCDGISPFMKGPKIHVCLAFEKKNQ